MPQPSTATDAQLQQFFESTKAQFCPSGTVVAHILVKTKAEADAVEAALAQGADFATLAAQKSTDTGSATRGGLVACTDSQQFTQLAASFRAGADSVPLEAILAAMTPEQRQRFTKYVSDDVACLPARQHGPGARPGEPADTGANPGQLRH